MNKLEKVNEEIAHLEKIRNKATIQYTNIAKLLDITATEKDRLELIKLEIEKATRHKSNIPYISLRKQLIQSNLGISPNSIDVDGMDIIVPDTSKTWAWLTEHSKQFPNFAHVFDMYNDKGSRFIKIFDANIEELYSPNEEMARDVIQLLQDFDLWYGDIAIYFDGVEIRPDNGICKGVDPSNSFECNNEYFAMSFEGDGLSSVLSNNSPSIRDKYFNVLLIELFAKYELYYEFGDSWNLSLYEESVTCKYSLTYNYEGPDGNIISQDAWDILEEFVVEASTISNIHKKHNLKNLPHMVYRKKLMEPKTAITCTVNNLESHQQDEVPINCQIEWGDSSRTNDTIQWDGIPPKHLKSFIKHTITNRVGTTNDGGKIDIDWYFN